MVTRRDFLKATAAVAAGATSITHAAPAPKARAKSIIQIWMWGGPSHLDTFDPKPGLGNDFCGPLTKPIATNADGIQIGEQFPLMAKQMDKVCVLRSMTHGVNAHETASYLVQTGRAVEGKTVYPALGAIVSRMKGAEHRQRSSIPPYIVLTTSQGRFSKAGSSGRSASRSSRAGTPTTIPSSWTAMSSRAWTGNASSSGGSC